MLVNRQSYLAEITEVEKSNKHLEELKEDLAQKKIAKLKEMIFKEQERGKQLSAIIRAQINEIMDLNINPKIKAEGKKLLESKNDDEEHVAVKNLLKLMAVCKKSNSYPFFSKSSGDQEECPNLQLTCRQ